MMFLQTVGRFLLQPSHYVGDTFLAGWHGKPFCKLRKPAAAAAAVYDFIDTLVFP